MTATILVVDDYSEELQLSCYVLEQAGFLPIETTSAEALIQAQLVKPDLILMDVRLPKLEGLELCRLLKTTPDICKIPIVVVSAISEDAIAKQAYALGAAEFILKPFNIDQLIASVKKHLNLSKEQEHP